MDIFTTVTLVDLAFFLFWILSVFFLRAATKRVFPTLPINIVTLGFIYHMVITAVFFYLTLTVMPIDVQTFFGRVPFGGNWTVSFGVSTAFMHFIIFSLRGIVGLNYISIFLLFSTIGFVGVFFLICYFEDICPTTISPQSLCELRFIFTWFKFLG